MELRLCRTGKVFAMYLMDFCLTFVLLGLALALQYVAPFERPVFLDDRSIQYPHKPHDIVPGHWLPLIVGVVPCIVVLASYAQTQFKNRRILVAILGVLLAISTAFLVTNIVKNMVGRLRPDYLARCNPDPAIKDRIVCRGIARKVQDGRRSFPSGHSATSFAAYGFIGLFMAGQLCLYDGQGLVWKWIAVVTPYMIATIISLSRIIDWRHHVTDVVAGSVIGLVTAYFVYRMYFPSIFDPNVSAKPYTTRYDRFRYDLSSSSNASLPPSVSNLIV